MNPIFYILISFLVFPFFLLADEPHEDDKVPTPPKTYRIQPTTVKKPKGFGLSEKQFLEDSSMPENIRAVSEKSVNRVCACVVKKDSCITVFMAKKGNIFLTNEHAIQFLIDERDENAKKGRKCVADFVSLDKEGKTAPLKLEILKRGKYKPGIGRGEDSWNPSKYYDKTADEFSNHVEDLAAIRISGLSDTAPIPFADVASKGSKVFHMGYSVCKSGESCKSPQVSDGKIYELGNINGEADFLGLNGTSGGPVVDSQGKLVGVFWGKQRTWREELFRVGGDPFTNVNGFPRERSLYIPLPHIEQFLKDVQ